MSVALDTIIDKVTVSDTGQTLTDLSISIDAQAEFLTLVPEKAGIRWDDTAAVFSDAAKLSPICIQIGPDSFSDLNFISPSGTTQDMAVIQGRTPSIPGGAFGEDVWDGSFTVIDTDIALSEGAVDSDVSAVIDLIGRKSAEISVVADYTNHVKATAGLFIYLLRNVNDSDYEVEADKPWGFEMEFTQNATRSRTFNVDPVIFSKFKIMLDSANSTSGAGVTVDTKVSDRSGIHEPASWTVQIDVLDIASKKIRITGSRIDEGVKQKYFIEGTYQNKKEAAYANWIWDRFQDEDAKNKKVAAIKAVAETAISTLLNAKES